MSGALVLGAVTIVLGVAYICLDALGTPAAQPTSGGRADRSWVSALLDEGRRWVALLPLPAVGALIISGVFAWLTPSGTTAKAAELPGMAEVIGWTTLAIAAPVTAALISMLLGVSGGRAGLLGGSWATLVLAFSVLNTVALGAGIALAHLVGPVTGSTTTAMTDRMIYLPYLITAGVPLTALAAAAAGVTVTLTELARRWRTHKLPPPIRQKYQQQAAEFMDGLSGWIKYWYWSGLPPFNPYLDDANSYIGSRWERMVARAQLGGRMLLNIGWVIWGIIITQLAMILCTWQLHWQLPGVISKAGIVIASLTLPARIGFLFTKWGDPAKRTMTTFWDIATFWPRSYHPFAPPCYVEGAVPELQRRMLLLHNCGRQLVLVAHGQGAMIATAALVQRGSRSPDDSPALVTFGSTVGKLYGWVFPAYVTYELESLRPGGPGRLRDWRNLYYSTDPLGGPVVQGLTRGFSVVNHELLDPAHSWYIYREDPPMPLGHSGYWDDPRVLAIINSVAANARHTPAAADGGQPSVCTSRAENTEDIG